MSYSCGPRARAGTQGPTTRRYKHQAIGRPCLNSWSPVVHTPCSHCALRPSMGCFRAASRRPPTARQAAHSQASTKSPENSNAMYQVLLAMVGKLYELQRQQQTSSAGPSPLDKLIAAKPEVLSLPFLLWLADQEAQAQGEVKQRLAAICEYLVIARELLEQDRFTELHANTLDLLTNGGDRPAQPASTSVSPATIELGAAQGNADTNPDGLSTPDVAPQLHSSSDPTVSHSSSSTAANTSQEGLVNASSQSNGPTDLAVLSDPVQYAVRLAEAVTGAPVQVQGYNTLYDAILQVAPPAALSPEGLALAHAQAQELGQDLKAMRKRSLSSVLGQVKVSEEQVQQFMAGAAASRILDLLLGLPDMEERVALLPDCFTPPSDDPTPAPTPAEEESDTEPLWCTPAQMLSEIDTRLKSLNASVAVGGGEGAGPSQLSAPLQLAPLAGELVGPELLQVLIELRQHVNGFWMASMNRSDRE